MGGNKEPMGGNKEPMGGNKEPEWLYATVATN
jgi:hypothetical protein